MLDDVRGSIESTGDTAAMELALIKARNVSKRAAFGWVLLDSLGTVLTYGASKAGLGLNELPEAIRQFKVALNHLVMTVDPRPGYCNIGSLTSALESTSCQKISLAYSLASVCGSEWRSWVNSWSGELQVLESSYFSESLAAGMKSVYQKSRPWVIAVSASTLENQQLPFKEINVQFGFGAFMKELVSQNRGVIFNETNGEIRDFIRTIMTSDNEILTASDTVTLVNVVENIQFQDLYSALLFCNPSQLSELVNCNLVDEIFLHQMVFDNRESVVEPSSEFPMLKGWTVLASDVVGNSIRTQICNNLSMPSSSVYPNRQFN